MLTQPNNRKGKPAVSVHFYLYKGNLMNKPEVVEVKAYHIVYLTTNPFNNKIYVGKHSTNNLNDGYKGSGKYLNKAFKKYGKKHFKFQILHYCLTLMDAYEVEGWIVDQAFIDRPDTYNVVVGGRMTPDWTGKKRSEECIAKHKMYRATEETKKLISIANTGKIKTPEQLELMRTLSTGRKDSEETKQKKRLANLGRKHTEEALRKMRGRKLTKEHINKLTGRKRTEETLLKLKCRVVKPESILQGVQTRSNYFPKLLLISPTGETHIIQYSLQTFCRTHNLSYTTIFTNLNKGPIKFYYNSKSEKYINSIGWELRDDSFSQSNIKLPKEYLIISPDGKEHKCNYISSFCRQHNLSNHILSRHIDKGIISCRNGKSKEYMNNKGWEIRSIK